MTSQDNNKNKETGYSAYGTGLSASSFASPRENHEGSFSPTVSVPVPTSASQYHSKTSHSPFQAPQRATISSNSASSLNANISAPIMNSSLASSPQNYSSSLSASSFAPGAAAYSSAIQKSISALDVKAMARDISMGGDRLNTEESWPSLVVRVLPLFNGERLGGHVEDLNEVVRACLRLVDISTLTEDIYKDLLAAGMFTINAKLVGVHEEKVASRLVELWSFFLGTVLPYLEGVFLPHQIEILKLKRSHNLNSVRTMALTSFKEQVIVPFMERLEASIYQLFKEEATAPSSRDDTAAKLLQMMSILNMSPPLSNKAEQEQFDHISTLLKNKWKERLHRS